MIRLLPYEQNSRRNDLANMIDDFFDFSLSNIGTSNNFKMDIIEKNNLYVIKAELPGINKEDINIEVDDGTLTISVNSVEENEEVEENKYLHRERAQRSMSRGVYLGEIDEESISASLKDGILEVLLPKKKEEDSGKKINID